MVSIGIPSSLAARQVRVRTTEARSARARQGHREARAAALGVLGAGGAAVRVDDRGHDGEAETGSGLAALSATFRPPEPLEQPLVVAGGEPGPVVADHDRDGPVG